jgi:heme-degrading monooxygenase HmoA
MYARFTRLTQSPDRLEQTISTFESTIVEPLRGQRGYAGMGLAVDRAEGSAIAFSLWDTQDAMNASEQVAAQLRDQAETEQGASIGSVERFEVSSVEGTYNPGTFSRVVSMQIPPAQVEEFEREWRNRIVPLAKGSKGFCRVAGYVNRETGSVVGAGGWETEADRDATDTIFAPLRRELSERFGATTPVRIELCELVFADVRVQAPTGS